MSTSTVSQGSVAAYMHVDGFDDFMRDAFDKREVRKAMRKAGAAVQRKARSLITKSGTGDYPQQQKGLLRKSIRGKVSRSGFMVKIEPGKVAGMKDYYPAYLHYGVKQGARIGKLASGRRAKGQRAAEQAARSAGGWRIKPRGNYMADALEAERSAVVSILSSGFKSALR